MANRYNRWAPTAYVGLPVDYYQQALGVQEQRTAEAIEKIEGMIAHYGAIQPVSADAQALYDQSINQLRTNVEGLVKENLDTPTAQRKINKMFTDPVIVDNLDKVYTDALLAGEARKNLNEYLKKNPAVNATEYLTAFNKLGQETGDASKFNPNRFRNMGPLVDYYDVNKLIADEVTKLKENESEIKKIMGDKYITYKESGVLEDRIRELARDRVLSDPQAYAQFQRNMNYQNYLANPYDIAEGMKKNASAFRAGISQQQQTIQNRISQLAAGRTDDQLKEKDPKVYAQIEQGRRALKDLNKYVQQSLTGEYDISDEDVVNRMGMDRFVQSFDAYAWRKTKQEEEWTPMAIAEFNARETMKRLRVRESMRKKTLQDLFNPEIQHLTIPGTAEQTAITPDQFNDYISERIPGLKLNISKEGFLTGDQDIYTKSIGKDGKYYKEEDITMARRPPEGYEETPIGYARGANKYYVKKGAQSWAKPPDSKEIAATNIQNLKSYVERKGLGTNYDWTNEADQRRALQDVIRFNQSWERAYMTAHTFPAGNTDGFRERVVEMMGRTPFYDEKGKIIPKDELPALADAIRKTKPTINGQPTDFSLKQPVYTFNVNGVNYKVPMHLEMQATLAVPNDMLNRAMNSETGVFTYGANNDLFINKMGPDGRPINMVVAGGGNQTYQESAKKLYQSNIDNLKEIGYSEQEARDFLDKNYLQIQDAINSDYKKGFEVNNPNTGKSTFLKYAVGRHKEGARRTTFKYFTNQLSPSPDLGKYIYDRMQEFGGARNPGMSLLGYDLFTGKEKSAIFQGITADDDYGLEDE